MSYRASALRGFRFDERLCTVSGSCTELDAGFFLKRGGWDDAFLRPGHWGEPLHQSARTWGVRAAPIPNVLPTTSRTTTPT